MKIWLTEYIISIVGGAVTFGLIAIDLRRRFERKYTRYDVESHIVFCKINDYYKECSIKELSNMATTTITDLKNLMVNKVSCDFNITLNSTIMALSNPLLALTPYY